MVLARNVHAGDTLIFEDYITSNIGGAPATGLTWYSNPALNSDGDNNVYSTSATAGQVYAGSPAGTYVAFEDLQFTLAQRLQLL